MMKPKIIIAVVFIAILLIILFQNTQVVTLRLLFWEISMSQILLTSLTLLIGLVSGYIVAKVLGARQRNT
ncbi:MAG: lipopolysaccharide assembly protein LapA domain-containing protein [Candidatus Binatia bacterium]